MAYFEEQGWESDPWEHRALYRVFASHGKEYGPDGGGERTREYHRSLAVRLFECMNVRASADEARAHARALWSILGPESLALFPDAMETLQRLKEAGFPLAITSNWQCGLGHFCAELGLTRWVDHVLSSAEVGSEKPDSGIFLEACHRLGLRADQVLHVGDTVLDDWEGGQRAGLSVLLLRRQEGSRSSEPGVIRSLREVAERLGVPPLS
jgi:HAD superfamily hydrolase (TIGR01549 family)